MGDCPMTSQEQAVERAVKTLESLQDDLQGLKACVRGENRHSVVCMLEKLQSVIETLNRA
ncbi:hypothetical protein D3C85_1513140 [compost metagenome]